VSAHLQAARVLVNIVADSPESSSKPSILLQQGLTARRGFHRHRRYTTSVTFKALKGVSVHICIWRLRRRHPAHVIAVSVHNHASFRPPSAAAQALPPAGN
jgi:hypothetical protein